MARLSLLFPPISVLRDRRTPLTRLESLPNEALLNIFKQVGLSTRINLSRASTTLLRAVGGLGLLDFDLDNLSTSEETTILRSLPFKIAPAIFPDDIGGARRLVKARVICSCSCCDWSEAYKYSNQLSFQVMSHLKEEAEKRGLFLTRFMQPVVMHAIVLKVIEYERRLSYAGFLTLELSRRPGSEAADADVDAQEGADGGQDANEQSQALGAQSPQPEALDSEFDDFIVRTQGGELHFDFEAGLENESEGRVEDELDNELSELYDRRWDLRKDWGESKSEFGCENKDKGQKEFETGTSSESHQTSWQREQEEWRKEAAEAEEEED